MTRFFPALAATAATVLLAGCAGFSSQTGTSKVVPTTLSLKTVKGNIHGGQNPISFASVQVYQAGTTGTYGTGATPLIPTGSYYLGGAPNCVASSTQTCYTGVVSDANGNFALSGDYSCTLGTNLYFTATGGNPGGGTNSASLLMVGVGLCDNIPNIPFVQINEVTTVGAVWALSPFMSDTLNGGTANGNTVNVINVGAPSTNVAGLNAAFGDINTLVSYVSGGSPGSAAPSTATVPSSEIYAIANALAGCINTTNPANGTCSQLFGYTTVAGVAPTDVIGAALNITRNPAVNASNILQLASTFPPFGTNFNTTTVHDLTLAVTYTGNGLNAPSALAVDGSGNVWVANSGGAGTVTTLAHNGTPISGSPFAAGSSPSAIAIDTSGNAWIANSGSSNLTKLSSNGTAAAGSPFSGGGLSGPSSISFDGLGNVWVSNYSGNSISEFSASGTALSPATTGYTVSGLTSPIGIAVNPH